MPNELIVVSYVNLEKIATSFDEQAQLVAAQRKRIVSELTKLKHGWIAESASEFQTKMDADVLPGIQRLEAALRATALTVRDIVRVFKQAEDEGMAYIDSAMSSESLAATLIQNALMLGITSAIHPLAGLVVSAFMLNNSYNLNQLVGQILDTSGTDGFGTPAAARDLLLAFGFDRLGDQLLKNGKLDEDLVSLMMSFLSGETSNLIDGGATSFNSLLEGVIAAATEAGTELGLDAITAGLGEAVFKINDVHQLVGSAVGDISLLGRNLLSVIGGDQSGMWYGNMTDSINQFNHQINESDIGNLFTSFSPLVNDLYFRPVTDQVFETLKNPTLENMLSLSNVLMTRANSGGTGLYIIGEQFGHPARLNQTLTHATEFIGTVVDTGNAIANLPGTYFQHAGNMGLASTQWFLEHATMFDPTTRSALIDYAQQQYRTVDQLADYFNAVVTGNPGSVIFSIMGQNSAAGMLPQVDLSETLPNLAKPYIDGFTNSIDQLGIDDVIRMFAP